MLDEETVIKPQLKLDEAHPKIQQHDQLLWERELLGLYLSQHPLELYETFLSEQATPLNTLNPGHDGKQVNVGGAITDIREITTKNGQKMAFIKIEDQFSEIEIILFPNSYQRTVGLWQRDKVVLIRGKVSSKNRDGNLGEEVKIMVDDAREITPEQASSYQATGKKVKSPKAATKSVKAVTNTKSVTEPAEKSSSRIYIKLPDTENQEMLLTLKSTLDQYVGTTDVVLVLGDGATKQIIKLPSGVSDTPDAISAFSDLVGAANVKRH